jgi:GTP-binding protein
MPDHNSTNATPAPSGKRPARGRQSRVPVLGGKKPMQLGARLPSVAIVGRPNVGKSAIFNRLAGRRISIVHDQPGVTRDRIAADCHLGKHPFTVIDTGGICATIDDGFGDAVALEADIALETADVIVFVVDGADGMTQVDEFVATMLRKARRPVILAVNKIDDPKHDGKIDEFSAFGMANPIGISAAHGRGFGELVSLIESKLPAVEAVEASDEKAPAQPKRRPIQLALVGRPNVGKSSLVNALLEDHRTIVSDVAGTTRDAVDIPFSHGGLDYILIDTAGIRPKNKRDTAVEIFSVMRSERSIRRADVCCLVIDASTGVLAHDRKIAQMIVEAGKPCVIVLNKLDLYHPENPKSDRLEMLREHIGTELFFLHYAPMLAASALEGKHVNRIFKCVEDIRKASANGLNTGVLNRLLHEAMERKPPPSIKKKHNKRLKLLYATMAREDNNPMPIPVPEFVLFVNQADLLQDNYQRYLEARIREASPYTGIPLRFKLRERAKKERRK